MDLDGPAVRAMSRQRLVKRHQAVMPAWLSLYYKQPIHLVRGHGCRVTDAEGRTYLDFVPGIVANSLGYHQPRHRALTPAQSPFVGSILNRLNRTGLESVS